MTLKEALQQASKELEDLLTKASSSFEELGDQFVSKGIGILGGALQIYGDLFKRSGCGDRQSMETAISQGSSEIKKAAGDFMDLEADWSEFLKRVEAVELKDVDHVRPRAGDEISKEIGFEVVSAKSSDGTSTGDSKACETVTLGSILTSSGHPMTLVVLNRHFA